MNEAHNIIRETLARAKAPCVTSSFQADCVVLMHMLRVIRPDIPVLFLDTLHHFVQTCAYRDEIAARWRLNLINVQAAAPHPGLWRTDTNACCAHHKVEPLFAALESYDVWFTALRREQSPTRANLSEVEPFSLPSGRVLTKISPLARWTTADVFSYVVEHSIPLLPLYEMGYSSIGCEPCTSLPVDPANPRSGRWQGEKLECGIHIQPHKS